MEYVRLVAPSRFVLSDPTIATAVPSTRELDERASTSFSLNPKDRYRCLSNAFTTQGRTQLALCIGGIAWPSIEHWLHAAKFMAAHQHDDAHFQLIAHIHAAPTAADALRIARFAAAPPGATTVDVTLIPDGVKRLRSKVAIRPDWEFVRNALFNFALRRKFDAKVNAKIYNRLLETGGTHLRSLVLRDRRWFEPSPDPQTRFQTPGHTDPPPPVELEEWLMELRSRLQDREYARQCALVDDKYSPWSNNLKDECAWTKPVLAAIAQLTAQSVKPPRPHAAAAATAVTKTLPGAALQTKTHPSQSQASANARMRPCDTPGTTAEPPHKKQAISGNSAPSQPGTTPGITRPVAAPVAAASAAAVVAPPSSSSLAATATTREVPFTVWEPPKPNTPNAPRDLKLRMISLMRAKTARDLITALPRKHYKQTKASTLQTTRTDAKSCVQQLCALHQLLAPGTVVGVRFVSSQQQQQQFWGRVGMGGNNWVCLDDWPMELPTYDYDAAIEEAIEEFGGRKVKYDDD